MDNFKSDGCLHARFTDVSSQWLTDAVAKVCELGLAKGSGDGTFQPEGDDACEAITMAVRLNSIYRGLGDSFPPARPGISHT